MTFVAVIASACPCAAQDGPRDNLQNKPEDHLLLEQALRLLSWDSYVIVFPKRVVVRSGASVVLDGRSEPILELICQDRTAELHDRAAATHDLYPVPQGFCETLRVVFGPGKTGGRR